MLGCSAGQVCKDTLLMNFLLFLLKQGNTCYCQLLYRARVGTKVSQEIAALQVKHSTKQGSET